ncbi:hypothetical protein LUZ61_015437 [Rhynchospora tenuis]|uniref:F-box domain-containing protein n=1 Tax=Rhynchospora tenuis TaxID=198213 RepID=A0AAD5Z3M2_9POAL|nr:hypothetical protein LUZ61_015437 [Rhynchospora tenuis]
MAEVELEADRISLLPLDIKISVLSRLSIKDALRTSALARSWRHIWTHLPCLRLYSCQNPLDNPDIQTVHRLISSLRGPLLDFQLFSSGPHDDQSVLQSLLDLLLQKGGVQTLGLYLHDDPKVILPSFHSLRELTLSRCTVLLPTGFPGFHLLKTLDMYEVEISNDDLNLLLRTSNNLTTLSIFDSRHSGNPLSVNLSLPLLRRLLFEINDVVENVSVVSSPCLEYAVIKLSDVDISQNLAKMMLRLVTSVAMVSSLQLDFDVLNCFSLVPLPINFTIPRLKFLRFYLDVHTLDKRVYDAFFWLLRSMPFLEELEVELETIVAYDQADRVAILMRQLLVKKHDGFVCLERTLTSVTIEMDTLDVIASIAWIQFFMLNAKGLKLLKIDFFGSGDLVPSFIEELQKAQVTSSGAKLMIFNSYTRQITTLCMNG